MHNKKEPEDSLLMKNILEIMRNFLYNKIGSFFIINSLLIIYL